MSPKDSYPENQCEKQTHSKSLCIGTVDYMWTSKRPHFIIGLALFIISIILIVIFVALQLSVIYSYNYAIVIDAGSTGTRAFLYEWKDEKGVINDAVTERTSCKTMKLQDLPQNETNNGLLDCISSIIKVIPKSYVIKTSIYLAATAGMRLYQLENRAKTDQMFENINKLFAAKGWNSKFVGIIDGQTEAVSAWITANYLKNTIGKNKLNKDVKTIGALDLGGASTQIAFETNQSNIDINLYNQKYSLYGVSYLCYGANMFYIYYLSSLATNSKETEVNCVLKNGKIPPKEDSITCRVNGSQSIDFNHMTKPIATNSEKCRKQIKNILISTIPKTLPVNDMHFVAQSSFYYYRQFLNDYANTTNTFSSFINSTDKFCEEDANDLKNKFPSTWKYALNYCFQGNYIISLLQLYGFNENNFGNIEFTDKIQGLSVGWNLGYIIEKTRYIPDVIIHRLNMTLFIVVVTLSAVFLLLATLLFLFTIWERRQKVENIDP